MDTNKTGGAAFPNTDQHTSEGMTLLDYFAAKAMEGHISAMNGIGNIDYVAELSYAQAAAMLKERQKHIS